MIEHGQELCSPASIILAIAIVLTGKMAVDSYQWWEYFYKTNQ
jgi:hypothetical protein